MLHKITVWNKCCTFVFLVIKKKSTSVKVNKTFLKMYIKIKIHDEQKNTPIDSKHVYN